ncbi:hypothetical protein TNCV_1120931 [Trichonephila clavipes]|uniref:ATP-dependent DNA helicase n=1 Tax=Trichonephila clavipes TaxID=2585209 RepID=A0A8X6VSH7_TRICX|nr:hypothetical protein TNCV_1120931 [Trichonephila clavipes]
MIIPRRVDGNDFDNEIRELDYDFKALLHQDLRDIMGGMVALLAGDFRQTLPVIQRGIPAVETRACIKSSTL